MSNVSPSLSELIVNSYYGLLLDKIFLIREKLFASVVCFVDNVTNLLINKCSSLV